MAETKLSDVNALDSYCFRNNIPDFIFTNTFTSVTLGQHPIVPLKLEIMLPEINEYNLHIAKDSLANAALTYLRNGRFSHLEERCLNSCTDILSEYTICATSNVDEAIAWCEELIDMIVGIELEVGEDFLIKKIIIAGNKQVLIYTLTDNVLPEDITAILSTDKIKKVTQLLDVKNVIFKHYGIQVTNMVDVCDIAFYVYGFRQGTHISKLAEWNLRLTMIPYKIQKITTIETMRSILYIQVYTRAAQHHATGDTSFRLKWTLKE